MKDEECLDRTILALRAKYQQKKSEQEPVGEEIQVGVGKVALYREILFNGRYSMLLPQTMGDMDVLDSTVKYRNQNRPQVIKTDQYGDVSITFNILPMPDAEESESNLITLQQMRRDMKKVWKQNVFYDIGEVLADELSVAWMDFRAFCLDGSLYILTSSRS